MKLDANFLPRIIEQLVYLQKRAVWNYYENAFILVDRVFLSVGKEKYGLQNTQNTCETKWEKYRKRTNISILPSLSQYYLASPIPLHVRYIGHQCSKYLIQIKEKTFPTRNMTVKVLSIAEYWSNSTQKYFFLPINCYICWLRVFNWSDNWTSVVVNL